MLFPEREVLLYNVAAQSTEITEQRLQVIEALLLKQNVIVVASIQAVLALQCPPQVFKDNIFTLKVGDIAPLEQLSEKLVRMGYERVSAVEGKGQFSVRGGILDVFPLTSDDPYRIEFFDDEVDSIRIFDVSSQRSVEKVENATISPARELVLTKDAIAGARDRINKVMPVISRNMAEKDKVL